MVTIVSKAKSMLVSVPVFDCLLWMMVIVMLSFSLAQVDGLVDFYEQHVPVKARVSKSNS